MTAKAKVLFIGLDSAAPNLMRQWGQAGLLPAWHAFEAQSLRGATSMPPGLGSGAMWISLFSGVSPAEHGRYFGHQFRGDTYRVSRFQPGEIKGEPVWSAASRAGKRVAVIDAPVAPLCEGLNGIQIIDWGTHDPFYPTAHTWPPGLAAEVTTRFGSDPVGPCDRGRRGPRGYQRLRDRMVERVGRKAEMACHFLDRGGWDLFMVVFADAHCIGHQCWHLHDPGHPMHDPSFFREFGDPIEAVYRALDKAIGRLLQVAGPEATVILFAGGGMGPNSTANHLLEEILRRLDGIPPSPARRSVNILRGWYNRLVPDVIRSRLMPLTNMINDASRQGDRARRRYFQIPHHDFSGAIRFNLVGRERDGRLHPGAECDAVSEELTRDLLQVVNANTGRPIVREVLRTAAHFEGNRLADLPDLLVEWNREAPITAVRSPKVGEVQGVYLSARTGDHAPDSLYCVRGPGLAPGENSKVLPVETLARTIAALLGMSLPRADGMPLTEFWNPLE
jgi:predicted AlkP superfamily phosphohydrolase/phosphomutase